MQPSSSDRRPDVLGAGLTWAVSVALLSYGGHLLDDWLGTTALFLVLGALCGIAGGFLHFLARVAPEMLPFGRKGKPDGQRSSSDSEPPPRA